LLPSRTSGQSLPSCHTLPGLPVPLSFLVLLSLLPFRAVAKPVAGKRARPGSAVQGIPPVDPFAVDWVLTISRLEGIIELFFQGIFRPIRRVCSGLPSRLKSASSCALPSRTFLSPPSVLGLPSFFILPPCAAPSSHLDGAETLSSFFCP